MLRFAFFLLSWINVASAATPWASIGAFYPGMSKAEAKAAGYEACKNADRDEVHCYVPASARKLGNLRAAEAVLIFKPPRHDRVVEIQIRAEGKLADVTKELTRQFGVEPYRTGPHQLGWFRDGPELVYVYTKLAGIMGTVPVMMKYDPATAASYRKAVRANQEAARKKADTLKTF